MTASLFQRMTPPRQITLILYTALLLSCPQHLFGNAIIKENIKKSPIRLFNKRGVKADASTFKINYITRNDTIWAYYTGKKHRGSYCIPLEEVSKELGDIKKISANIRILRKEDAMKKYRENASELFRLLLEPAVQHLEERVTINATGILRSVPWSTLIKSDGKYMIYDHEIVIKDREYLSTHFPHFDYDFIKIAPEFSSNLTLFHQEKDFRQNPFNSEMMDMSGLGSAKFLEAIDNKTIRLLHFSTHLKTQGEKTGILMAQEEDFLPPFNIQKSVIFAELVFINTCKSAIPIQDDEKEKSFVDIFLKSGAQSGVGTLWDVDDESAGAIAGYFYDALRKGVRKSEALRKAQLAYLEDAKNGKGKHPYYWGGHQFYGDERPLYNKTMVKLKSIYTGAISLLTPLSILMYYFGHHLKQRMLFIQMM